MAEKHYFVRVPGRLPTPFQALYGLDHGQLVIMTQSFLVSRPQAVEACKLTLAEISAFGLERCEKHEVQAVVAV